MEALKTNTPPRLVDQLRSEPTDEKSLAGVLSRIILLEGDIRKVSTINEFGVLAVNETHRIIPYFQCFMWRKGRFGKLRIQAVSGASQVDGDAPSVLLILKIVKLLAGKFSGKGLAPYTADPDSVDFYADWVEQVPPNVLWCEFAESGEIEKLPAGLLFFAEEPFTSRDVTTLTPVLDAYRYTWSRLPAVQRERRSLFGRVTRSRIFRFLILTAIIGVMFMPVRESVLATATIVPKDPVLVSAPIGGVVDSFHVQPNQEVEQQQLLISLDDREIRNEVAVASRELETARAEYSRAAQKSFTDEDSKAELELQKARVAQKVLEKEYASARLEQTRIYAGRDGIAVFTDENDWLGRPVSVGEKIMTLADPGEKEVDIFMPIADALYLQPGAEIRLFLNTDPTRPLKGQLTQTSYEPSEHNKILSYPLKAEIVDESDFSRLGWQGTAKVYSNEEVTLFYYLFRKPISATRQLFGF